MRIGIDLDGVVYDIVTEFKYMMYGSPAFVPDPHLYDCAEAWGWTEEEFDRKFSNEIENGYIFSRGRAYLGAITAIKDLYEDGHEIVFITARPPWSNAPQQTADWLYEKGIPYSEIHYMGDELKSSVLVDIMVEDNFENLMAFQDFQPETRRVLMSRPWNTLSVDEAKDVDIIKDLEDVGDIIKEMQRSKVLRDHVNARTVSRAEFLDSLDNVLHPSGFENETLPPGTILSITKEPILKTESETNSEHSEMVVSPTGARKGQKAEKMSLVPVEELQEVARLYSDGAKKYAAWNWAQGLPTSASYDALMRHLMAFWQGEDLIPNENEDPTAGRHHLAAVVFHAFSMMYNTKHYPELDDRPHTFLENNDVED